jgi:hypothetical protein
MSGLSLPSEVKFDGRTARFKSALDEKTWKNLGPVAATFQDSLNFFLGDWLNYGRLAYRRWREEDIARLSLEQRDNAASAYADAIAKTHYAYGTLRDCSWVCRNLSVRIDKLPWAHHRIIAPLEPDAQKHWLKEAVSHRLSVSDLRLELRSAARSDDDSTGPPAGTQDFPAWLWDAQRWLARQDAKTWTAARRSAFRDAARPVLLALCELAEMNPGP